MILFANGLLKGRREMLEALPWQELRGGARIDLGAGTGANIEFVAADAATLSAVHLVDLSESLLGIAKKRIARHGWEHVHTKISDATTFAPPAGPVDLVTFSYSLTMIPDWRRAVDHALELLRPGGILGVVDFHVSDTHDWLTRRFWPAWFAQDSVFLSPEHARYLDTKFERLVYEEARTKLPYFPLGTVPYYRFVGRTPIQ